MPVQTTNEWQSPYIYRKTSKAHLIYGWNVALALLSAVSLLVFLEFVNPVFNELGHCLFSNRRYSPELLKPT
jgi:hypothetical protein